jgi:hypothetical protein
MCILRKRAEDALEVLVQHRVQRDRRDEGFELVGGRELFVDQQVRDLEKRALLGELLDRVPAIAQDALLAVDERDRALAGARVRIARIEGDVAGLTAELPDVDRALALRAFHDRELEGATVDL